MKFQASELPVGKPLPTRRKTSKLAPLVALTVLLTIPLYYPTVRDTSKKLYQTSSIHESLVSTIEEDVSHLETLGLGGPIGEAAAALENIDNKKTDKPCLVDSRQCINERNGDDSGAVVPHDDGNGDTEVVHQVDVPVNRKKHEKGRRKKTHRPQPDKQITRNAGIQRGNDPIFRGNDRVMIRSGLLDDEQCDLFSGEWIPNPDGPFYTNETCNAIQEHQNCLKFGRPDRGFLKWRWKPDECELQVFDANKFLELVRGKSIAFVGDSVARNHMQSLICQLSRVYDPLDLSDPLDQNKRYEFRDHDFNISMFWAPYLVRTEKTDPNDEKRPFKLYLDEFDDNWKNRIALFDFLIISAGHWFFRPTYFYINSRLVGCLYCPESNVSHLTSYFSYRRAFRTAMRAVADSDFSGVTFLRTYAPSHFEGAAWDKGGDCVRTGPFKRNEVVLEDYGLEMYLIQLEELRIAQRAWRRIGGKFRLFDATKAMLLRPDGHPGKYGHWQVANQTFANDCVHWCLPGPIDSWNDFLQELLKRETGNGRMQIK